MRAHINVTEPKVPEDPDSPLAFSMEGYPGAVPGSLIPYFWAPGWNSIQSVNKFQEEVGGPLRGGDPGVRLIEASPAARCPYFGDVPAAFEPRGEERLVVPLYHIFGSEELSVLSPSMADRAPRPYLALSEADAAALNVAENDTVELQLRGAICRLPVNVVRGLPAGVVGRPVGVDGGAGAGRPDRGRIARGSPP
jgi:NADH-quinone oxidoreductase subunit G